MMHRHAVVLATVVALASGCYAGPPGAQSCADLQDSLEYALAQRLVPGGVMVLATDEAQCEIAAGRRDLVGREELRPDDRFRIGSVAKTFVATVALQLEAEGRLRLDDSVATPYDIDGAQLTTMRDLLAHTSGLPDYSESAEFWTDATAAPDYEWDDEELLEYAWAQPRRFAPGADWAYSNTDYVVLAMVLERVLGHSVEAAIDARIIEPLGLFDTSATDDARVVAGYGRTEIDAPVEDVTHLVHPSALGSGGAMVASAADLAEFYRAIGDGTLLDVASWTEMTAMRATTSELYPTAGLGVMTRVTPLGLALGHAGRLPGYGALAVRLGDDATAVLLVNRLAEDFDVLFDELVVSALTTGVRLPRSQE